MSGGAWCVMSLLGASLWDTSMPPLLALRRLTSAAAYGSASGRHRPYGRAFGGPWH